MIIGVIWSLCLSFIVVDFYLDFIDFVVFFCI